MQYFVAGPLAYAAIAISTVVSILALALTGDGELARRFAKTALGTAAALIVVQLMNYLFPWARRARSQLHASEIKPTDHFCGV